MSKALVPDDGNTGRRDIGSHARFPLFDLEDDESGRPLRGLDAVAERLDRFAVGAPGYVLRRLILVNYWHFDYEEIVVPHGRLFLLGENGSGKSTILGATVPLVLDGSVRPERLDTFGSTHRKIDHYVLGQATGAGVAHQRRTSYVALEFAWHEAAASASNGTPGANGTPSANGRDGWNSEARLRPPVPPGGERGARQRYLTVGICFAGNAEAAEPVRAYRFVVTSGKRLGIDIPLKSAEGRVHDALFFRNTMREHGLVTERQSEYRGWVSEWLFGTKDPRFMEHLVDVLLLLRQPSLSAQLSTFNDVYEYLKRALPPLPDEITSTTTEAFDRIDSLRQLARQLQRQAAAADRILAEDLALARAKARRRALDAIEAEREARARREAVEDRRRSLKGTKEGLARAEADHRTTQAELVAADEALAYLRTSAQAQEAETLGQLLAQAESEARLAGEMLAREEEIARDRQSTLEEVEARLTAAESARRGRLAAIDQHVEAIASQAEEARWAEGTRMAEELLGGLGRLRDGEEGRIGPVLRDTAAALIEAADRREAELEVAGAEHAEHERRLYAEVSAARRREASEREVIAATARIAEAEGELASRWSELAGRCRRATLSPSLASLGAEVVGRLGAVAETRQRELLRATVAEVERRGDERRAELAAQQERFSRELGEVGRELGELDLRIERFRSEPEVTPPRSPHREEARTALRAARLDCRPLYALLDFAPDLAEGERGQVERALLDAGLLDALVVRAEDAAATEGFLEAQGLADCWLGTVEALEERGYRDISPVSLAGLDGLDGLDGTLVVDPTLEDEDWREAGRQALGAVARIIQSPGRDSEAFGQDSGRNWVHGLLVGYSGPGDSLGLVGASNRRARRESELAMALASRDGLAGRIERLEAERAALGEAESQLRVDLQKMREAADERGIAAAEAARVERTVGLERARDELARASREAADLRAARESFEQGLVARLASLGLSGPDWPLVRRVARVTRDIARVARALASDLERLDESDAETRVVSGRRRTLQEQVEASARSFTGARRRLEAAEEGVGSWRERLASADVAEFRRRLAEAEAGVKRLSAELLGLAEALGATRGELSSAERELVEAEEAARAAAESRSGVLGELADLLRLSPDVAERAPTDTEEATLSIARRLVPSGPANRERLDRDAERARDRRREAFDEERASLVDYDLFVAADERDRVFVRLTERSEWTLAELFRSIQGRIQENELLLNAEEERLFKDYLCDTGLAAIHRAVQAAERLVERINDLLERTPLGHERYELRMEVRADRREEGSPLARHHALFRKDPAAITDDERQALLEAVRAAVAEAHQRAEEGEGAFADLLTRAFDYREWFSLALFVTDGSGERRRISSRTARTRSGAQQLFALYVPLFAALAALYGNAAPHAPRLFAMDEAFDKVSEDNVTLLLRFLVDLGFQWIMASPRLSGAGREVLPACADWQLFHDQASALAQAIPIVYCDGEMLELVEASMSP